MKLFFSCPAISVAAVIIFSLAPLCVQAQHTISGKVIDAKSGEPMYGAHVFLAETTVGTTAGKNGEFTLSTNLTGKFTLVATFVGYEQGLATLQLPKDAIRSYAFKLDPEVEQIDELVVTSSNKEWRENLDRFMEEFIGQSSNAQNTVVENPEVINFEQDGRILSASTVRPLQIINNALGYRIQTELVRFEWHLNQDIGSYRVFPSFTELEPAGKDQKERWIKNREDIYKRSLRFFLKELFEHEKINKRHFDPNKPWAIEKLDRSSENMLFFNRQITNRKQYKAFRLVQPIMVEHGYSRSELFPGNKSGIFIINRYGVLFDPSQLQIAGAWANLRFGDFLPLDYVLNFRD